MGCVKLNDLKASAQIGNRSLTDTLPDLKIASQRPIPTVTPNKNGIQGVRLRGMRDENSSKYTCGLQEELQRI